MVIYFVYYFALLAIGLYFHVLGLLKAKGGKITYLSIVWLTLTLISGLRSFSMSYDAYAYASVFDYFADVPWMMPWDYSHFMEYGFYVLCKTISSFGGTARVMFFLTSGFIAFAICRFLYKNAEDLLLSVLLLLSFPYFYTSFDLIRHYIAVSIVLLAFEFVKQRRFWCFLGCVVVAMLFQKIAVVMLLFYWMPKIKWNPLTVSGAVAFTLLVMLFPRQIIAVLSYLFNDYKSYVSGGNVHWFGRFSGGTKTALMYFVILVIAVLAFQNKDRTNLRNHQSLGYVIAVLSMAIVYMNASMAIRLLVAFLPFLSVGLADLLDDRECHNQGTQVFLRCTTIAISIAYHAYLIINDWQNIVPYAIF